MEGVKVVVFCTIIFVCVILGWSCAIVDRGCRNNVYVLAIFSLLIKKVKTLMNLISQNYN